MLVGLVEKFLNGLFGESGGLVKACVGERPVDFIGGSLADFATAAGDIFTLLLRLQIVNDLLGVVGSFVIWVFGREESEGFAGVKAENLLFCGFGAVVTAEHGEVWVGGGIFALAYLYGGAAAIPAIGREIERPEGVGGGECGAVQNRVIFAHMVVLSGSVLEVVAVAVLLNLLPARSHEGSADGVVVLGIEVIVVVAVVYGLNIVAELLKGLDVAFVGQEGEPDLAESVERLEAGENESIVFESVADSFGRFVRYAGGNGGVELLVSLGNELAGLWGAELRSAESAGIIDHAGSVKKCVVVKIGVLCQEQSATR